jgi:hypothetical protein
LALAQTFSSRQSSPSSIVAMNAKNVSSRNGSSSAALIASRTLTAYSRTSQQTDCWLKPAVVIAAISGCVRAPVAVSSASHTARVLCWCSSSTIAPWTFRPSIVSPSAPSGSNFDCVTSRAGCP